MGYIPISVCFRFARFDGSERAVRDQHQSAGVDWSGDGAQETQTLLEIPDARTGEGVPVQRVRVETEAVGAGAEPEPDRATGEDLVPEQTDEEQEEQPEAAGADAEQQQFGDE